MLSRGQEGNSAPLSQGSSSVWEKRDSRFRGGHVTGRLGISDFEEECADLEISLKKRRLRAI